MGRERSGVGREEKGGACGRGTVRRREREGSGQCGREVVGEWVRQVRQEVGNRLVCSGSRGEAGRCWN